MNSAWHPGWLVPVLLLLLVVAGNAAEVGDAVFPDSKQVNGRTLVLNGFGRRTWSFLNIHIYMAGLYVEHPTHDPEAIIHSPEAKILAFRFEHDVAADKARDAWREGLANNCAAPCQVDPADVERFLAKVPAMRAGDRFELRFADRMAEISANGQVLGRVDRASLADAMLAAFLGPKPGSPALKQALLEGRG